MVNENAVTGDEFDSATGHPGRDEVGPLADMAQHASPA